MSDDKFAIIDVTSETKDLSIICSEKSQNEASCSYDGSLIQSPSVESFSTLQEIENLSELEVDSNGDIFVQIDSPQKHLDTLETYVTFRITTVAARSDYPDKQYIVRRRYNDFLWLRQKLVDTYPTYIVPPLPRKHSLIGQLDRYSKEFVIMRMKALNIFIARIVKHPILNSSECLKLFLTMNHLEFSLYRRSKSSNTSEKSQQINCNVNIFNVLNVNLKDRIPEFEKNKEYLKHLQDKLVMIEKISNRINNERKEFIVELDNLFPAFQAWSPIEKSISNMLFEISNALQQVSIFHKDLAMKSPGLLSLPIKDFMAYIEVVKEVLNRRDGFQFLYETSVEELAKKKAEKEELLVANQEHQVTNPFPIWKGPTSDQKLENLGSTIPQLVKQSETLQDQMECANEALRSDLQRWHCEKQAFIKKMLLNFALKHVECYEKSVAAWEKVITTCP